MIPQEKPKYNKDSITDLAKIFRQRWNDSFLDVGIDPKYAKEQGWTLDEDLSGTHSIEFIKGITNPKSYTYIDDPQKREQEISMVLKRTKESIDQLPEMVLNANMFAGIPDGKIPYDIKNNPLFGYLRHYMKQYEQSKRQGIDKYR